MRFSQIRFSTELRGEEDLKDEHRPPTSPERELDRGKERPSPTPAKRKLLTDKNNLFTAETNTKLTPLPRPRKNQATPGNEASP